MPGRSKTAMFVNSEPLLKRLQASWDALTEDNAKQIEQVVQEAESCRGTHSSVKK